MNLKARILAMERWVRESARPACLLTCGICGQSYHVGPEAGMDDHELCQAAAPTSKIRVLAQNMALKMRAAAEMMAGHPLDDLSLCPACYKRLPAVNTVFAQAADALAAARMTHKATTGKPAGGVP